MATTSELSTRTRTEKGVSLARGPALILGTILEVAGLYFLYKQHGFPKFANFPNGDAPVPGKVFFGIFGANGWTGLFTAAAGGLLLFGAAQHLLAKTMSLIVGVALGAAAVIAVISGNVLGLAAANGWTRLGWGVCALILLFNTLVPRRTRTIEEPVAEGRPMARRGPAPGQSAATEPPTRTEATRAESPKPTVADEPGARATTAAGEPGGRADAAETEPLVARDPEATRGERAGPLDDRGALHDRSEEPTRGERPPE